MSHRHRSRPNVGRPSPSPMPGDKSPTTSYMPPFDLSKSKRHEQQGVRLRPDFINPELSKKYVFIWS